MASANEKVKELMDENMPSRVDTGVIQCPQERPQLEVFSVRADNVDGEVLDGENRTQLYGQVIEIGSHENMNGFMDENMPSEVDANVRQPWEGWTRTLVEVFSVRIDNIDGGGPCQLYGKIIIDDGFDDLRIYNREKESCETICLGDTVSLTGPTTRSITVDRSFAKPSIDVALYNWDRREIIRGSISLIMYNCPIEYDMPLSIKVPGKHGGATVNYAVWRDATQALVEVTLVGCGGDCEEDHRANKVYGHLIACNSNFERHESVLFCMERKGEIGAMKKQKERKLVSKVRPGQLIPLLRSIVALPLDSSLIIKANLKDHNNGLFAEDPVIANGTADFPGQLRGRSEKYICGNVEGKKILLQVTWGSVTRAFVKVMLVKRGDWEEGYPAKVYGQLIAGCSNDFEHYERFLFNMKKKDGFIQEVRPGKLIPLLNSELPVRRCSVLTIKADLKHNNNNNDDSFMDPVIASGTAVFPIYKDSVKFIHGMMGKMIRVKVTWRSCR